MWEQSHIVWEQSHTYTLGDGSMLVWMGHCQGWISTYIYLSLSTSIYHRFWFHHATRLVTPCPIQASSTRKNESNDSDPRCKPSFLSPSWIPHKNEGSSSAASWGTDLPPPPFGLGKPWNVIPGSARVAPWHWLDEVNIRTILQDMLFSFPIETWGLDGLRAFL